MAKNKPADFLTPFVKGGAEAREAGRLGGLQSGKSRRKKKAMREVLNDLLQLPLHEGELVEEITSIAQLTGKGFKPNITAEQAILLQQILKAMSGDTKAATFVRDTAGEKILKDASDNHTEFEDDGFLEAVKKSSQGVWE